MYSITILLVIAVLGGAIAYVGDELGTKIGKKRVSVLAMRPKHSSILITVITGMLIAALTVGVMAYVSEDVRTALFGMDEIRAQLNRLNDSVATKGKEIEFTQYILAEKNKTLGEVDKNIAALTGEKQKAETALIQAQKDAKEALVVKQQLQEDIEQLNLQAKRLQEGLKMVRQGQIIFQAGELVGSGLLKTGVDEDANIKEVEAFLHNINTRLVNQLNIDNKELRILQLGELAETELLTRMKQAQGGSLYVRLVAAGNLVYGDPVYVVPQIAQNKLLYDRGAVIYRKEIDLRGQNEQQVLLKVLQEVNAAAVAKGVLPDPMTGTVGNLNIGEMVNITGEFQKNANALVVITAKARKDIYTADRLEIDITVQKVE